MTLTAAIAAVLNAAAVVVTNFWVNLTDTQKGSIGLLVNAVLVLGALIFDKMTKRTLTPPPSGSANGGTK